MASPLLNSLGDFAFIRLDGAPQVLTVHGSLVNRKGVSGTAAIREGIWGDPFTLRSAVDCLNLSDGALAIANYQASVFEELLPLVYAGVDYTQFGCLYLPIQVRPITLRVLYGA